MVDAETGRSIALRIEVDDQHALADRRQRRAEIDGGRGLADAALLVGEREDARAGRRLMALIRLAIGLPALDARDFDDGPRPGRRGSASASRSEMRCVPVLRRRSPPRASRPLRNSALVAVPQRPRQRARKPRAAAPTRGRVTTSTAPGWIIRDYLRYRDGVDCATAALVRASDLGAGTRLSCVRSRPDACGSPASPASMIASDQPGKAGARCRDRARRGRRGPGQQLRQSAKCRCHRSASVDGATRLMRSASAPASPRSGQSVNRFT